MSQRETTVHDWAVAEAFVGWRCGRCGIEVRGSELMHLPDEAFLRIFRLDVPSGEWSAAQGLDRMVEAPCSPRR